MRVDDDGTRTLYYYSGLSVIAEEEVAPADAGDLDDLVLFPNDESSAQPGPARCGEPHLCAV